MLGVKFSGDASLQVAGFGFKYPMRNALQLETVSTPPTTTSTKAVLSENPSYPINSFPWPAEGAIFIAWKPLIDLSALAASRYIIGGPNSLSIDSTWANTLTMAMTPVNNTLTISFYNSGLSTVINRVVSVPSTTFLPGADNRWMILWRSEDASNNRWQIWANGLLLDTVTASKSTMPAFLRDLVIGSLASARAGLGGADAPIDCKVGLAEFYATALRDGEAAIITAANYGPGLIPPRNRWNFESGATVKDVVGNADLYTISQAVYSTY